MRGVARENGNVVAARQETANERLAEKARTAGNDDLHRVILDPEKTTAAGVIGGGCLQRRRVGEVFVFFAASSR
jgi:hypothetical protein